MRSPKNQLADKTFLSDFITRLANVVSFVFFLFIFLNISFFIFMNTYGLNSYLKELSTNILQNSLIDLTYKDYKRTGIFALEFFDVRVYPKENRSAGISLDKVKVNLSVDRRFNVKINWQLYFAGQGQMRIAFKSPLLQFISDRYLQLMYGKFSGEYQLYLKDVPLKGIFDIYFARYYAMHRGVTIKNGAASGRVEYVAKRPFDDLSLRARFKLNIYGVEALITNPLLTKEISVFLEPLSIRARLSGGELLLLREVMVVADPKKNSLHGELEISGLASFKSAEASLRQLALKSESIAPIYRFSYPWWHLEATLVGDSPITRLFRKVLHCPGQAPTYRLNGLAHRLDCQ